MSLAIGIINAIPGNNYEGDITTYLLRDKFWTSVDWGLVDGTLAEPGPGVREVYDSGILYEGHSRVHIVAGVGYENIFPTSDGTLLSYAQATRVPGRMVIFSASSVNATIGFGFGLNQTLGNAELGESVEVKFASGTITRVLLRNGSSFVNREQLGSYTSVIKTCTVLRATGLYGFVKSDVGNKWLFIGGISQQIPSPLYPMADRVDGITFQIKSVHMPDALWMPVPVISDGFGGANVDADGLGHPEGVAGGIGSGGGGSSVWAGASWSNSGGKTINSPSGSGDLFTNGDFTNWTADNPDGWTLTGTEDASNYVTENPAGHAQIVMATFGVLGLSQSISIPANSFYRAKAVITSFADNPLDFNISPISVNNNTFLSAAGTRYLSGFTTGTAATGAALQGKIFNTINLTLDSISIEVMPISSLIKTAYTNVSDVECTVRISALQAGGYAGLALRVDNPANPQNGVFVFAESGSIYVLELAGGVITQKLKKLHTFVAGSELIFGVNGNSYQGWITNWSGSQLIIDQGTTTVTTGNYFGLFSSVPNNQFDDFTLFAKGTSGEYTRVLDKISQ